MSAIAPTRLRPETFALTLTLAVCTALGPLATDMYLPSLPAIAANFEAPTARVQLTLSTFLLGFAAGQIVYGPLSDRKGRRPLLLIGIGIFILASVLCALAPNVELLVVARFLQAFGAAGPIVLARTVVRDLYEGTRAARELSRMSMIMGVVPAIAPIVGGVLHEAFGWRSVFWTCTGLAVALGLVVAAALPETVRVRLPDRFSPASLVRDFRLLLRHPTYLVYVTLSTLTFGGLFAFISGSSFVLQGVYRLSELGFALSFTAMVVGYVGGTILAQWLLDRRGLDGTIGIGVGFLAAGGLAMVAAVLADPSSVLAVVLPMAVYAFGVGLIMPQSMAAALTPFPTHAGAASSFLGICQNTGAALVGIVVGQGLSGTALPMTVAIAATGCGAAGLFLATAKLRRG